MTNHYSFVLPVYNEKETLPTLRERMARFLETLDGTAEVILVDDGSRDNSWEMMEAISREDPRFKTLRLSRNFGHQIAITAGIDYATGAAVIVMDSDLQDPPEVVTEMIAKWKEGFAVVYGKRGKRIGETAFKKFTAHIFYRLLGSITEVDIPTDVGDFRLMDRTAVEALKAMREQARYVRGMVAWLGFTQTAVEYTRDERFAGETKYPLRKMLLLAANGIVGFSSAPLRLIMTMGFFIAAISFVAGVTSLVLKIAGVYTVTGWASIIFAVFFMGGVQLVMLGVMGEYIGRIYDESKKRPLYFVRQANGFSIKPAWNVEP